ncbi:serine/threonine-protein kinase [Nocardiopsis ganjiahuensis]|uniref:serine/threonine-protein kinase n=1 Tax=Nocardiopsis ganjiahuensis TaxID=239984 RepID=UPI00034587CE|nr:serine/threonine-protein kinase [Nocardiopsis ganjiahuensis]
MSPAQNAALLPATATDLLPTDPAEIGPYRLLKRLGAGGMGAVYAARAQDGSLVALKVVHPEFAADPEFRSRFAREVEMLARVGGACAVPLLAADTECAQPWLATPLVRGLTLNAYLRENKGPMAPALVHGLAVGIAEALAQIHSAGVVHRDLKPANIVVSPEGPRVLDFGIARALDQTALTRTGSVLGSSGWISPAHYRGDPISTADDIFAWGALVTYAATGRPPFGGGDPAAVAHRVMSGEPDTEGFDGPLADLARRALDKDADRRPTAMALVIGVMQLVHLGRPVSVIDGPTSAGAAVAQTLQATWHGVRAPVEQEVAVPRGRRGTGQGRGRRTGLVVAAAVTALLLVGTGVGGAAVAGNWDSLPIAAWFGADDEGGDGTADKGSAGDSGRSAATSSGGPSEEPPGDPSDEDGDTGDEAGGEGAGEEDGADGEDGGAITTMATVGAGVSASGPRPPGTHVVAFEPSNGSGRYAVLDGATVVCAWSFCQGQGGAVGDGDAGSVASSPTALTGYVNSGSRTVSAEITYTESGGTVTITRLVEHHRTSGSGTPPW